MNFSQKLVRTGGPAKINDTNLQDLAEASKFLKDDVIVQFVSMLDDLQMLPVDSESLGFVMH